MRWTEEARQRQSEAIKRWRPWESSTGPRSAEGKAVASQNAFKHGMRSKDAITDRGFINEMLSLLI